jgi:HlyD family secretion protein
MNITSEVQGRIEEIYVKEGDQVSMGQLLVRLDPDQLQSSTDAQTAAYEGAQDDVRSAQTQVSAAQNALAQSLSQLNVADVAVDTARQQVIAAQTDVAKAQVELNAAMREMNRNQQLLEANVISRQVYDESKDRVESARASLNTANSNLQARQLGIRDAEARRNQQLVAVRDGRRAVETANINVSSSQSRADQQAANLRGAKSQRN